MERAASRPSAHDPSSLGFSTVCACESRLPERAEADRHLIEQATLGAAQPLKELLARLTPVIRGRVRRSLERAFPTSSAAWTDDLVQDVYVKLFAHEGRVLRSWQPSGGLSLDNYVRLVAQREVASLLRCRARTPLGQTPEDPTSLDERLAVMESFEVAIERRESLERLVERVSVHLSPLGRRVFHRLFIELRSPEQVSLQLHLSLAAVYQWRRRLGKLVTAVSRASVD